VSFLVQNTTVLQEMELPNAKGRAEIVFVRDANVDTAALSSLISKVRTTTEQPARPTTFRLGCCVLVTNILDLARSNVILSSACDFFSGWVAQESHR
jgi:hypothetical protein